MINFQQIVEKSVKGVLMQGCRSLAAGSEDICAYRGINGSKCAIGHLIDDQYYDPSFEGQNLYNMSVQRAVSKSLLGTGDTLPRKLSNLLIYLQSAHDSSTDMADFLSLVESNLKMYNLSNLEQIEITW